MQGSDVTERRVITLEKECACVGQGEPKLSSGYFYFFKDKHGPRALNRNYLLFYLELLSFWSNVNPEIIFFAEREDSKQVAVADDGKPQNQTPVLPAGRGKLGQR